MLSLRTADARRARGLPGYDTYKDEHRRIERERERERERDRESNKRRDMADLYH